MWDSREIVCAALRRAGHIKARRKRKIENLKTAALLTCCVTLAVCMIALSGLMLETGPQLPAQGSAVTPGDAAIGGYVLVGLLAFALGVVVTLICLRKRKK